MSVWQSLRRPNKALWLTLGTTGTLLAAVLAIGPLRDLFRFKLPASELIAAATALGLGLLVILERVKGLVGPNARCRPHEATSMHGE